ncbi:hypothetical protein OGAPHI_003556 [Ogataea philodendri]|uniref:Uncharacterized protein n=1 Tax=Ogataea philodendri TaxID=1378263 RepID=A0A9P8P6T5_9ASCO|nr:uncharacterized protein OGAPHI_003556 [Ogataea philodendri]KAH3666377.1 hypothetical protein OGAPHI_003556 [Ogataea philodendri]
MSAQEDQHPVCGYRVPKCGPTRVSEQGSSKSVKVTHKAKNRFVIARAIINGILKHNMFSLDLTTISKVASQYFSYLESVEAEFTQGYLNSLASTSFGMKGTNHIITRESLQNSEKVIGLKVRPQCKETINFSTSPYSKLRFRVPKLRSQARATITRSNKVVRQANRNQEKNISQLIRPFTSPFSTALIEDVFVKSGSMSGMTLLRIVPRRGGRLCVFNMFRVSLHTTHKQDNKSSKNNIQYKQKWRRPNGMMNDLMKLLEKPRSNVNLDEQIESRFEALRSVEIMSALHYQGIQEKLNSVLRQRNAGLQADDTGRQSLDLIIRNTQDQSQLLNLARELLPKNEMPISILANIVFKLDQAHLLDLVGVSESEHTFLSADETFLCKAYVLFLYRLDQVGAHVSLRRLLDKCLQTLLIPNIKSRKFNDKKYLRNLMTVLIKLEGRSDLIHIVRETECTALAYTLWETIPSNYEAVKSMLKSFTDSSMEGKNGLTSHQKLVMFLLSDKGAHRDLKFMDKINQLSKLHRLSYGECIQENEFLLSVVEALDSKKILFINES